LHSPDTGVTRYSYDQAGNLISQTDARGITANYHHDALNRLTFIDYPGSTEDVSYTYDGTNYGANDSLPAGTANAMGRLTGVIDPSGTTSYAYDAQGAVIEQARVVLNVVYRTRYAYDVASHLTGITYPNGRLVSLERDTLGQVSGLETSLNGHTQTLAQQVAYLPFGPASSAMLGNGLVSQKSHDLDYRIIQIQAGELQALNYYYDDRNNIEAIQNGVDANASQSFAYDALGRLHKAEGSYGIRDYGYDAVGNRLHETVSAPNANPYTLQYAYANDSHRLQAITGNGTNISLVYDQAGNIIRKGNMHFTYNPANRLSQVSTRKTLGSYQYDSKGQRVIKTAGKITTVYHYDLGGALIAETDDKGNVQKEYIHLNGQPLAQFSYRKKGKNLVYDIHYYHLDHLGTPQLMSNSNGQIVWRASYEPFGQATITSSGKPQPESNLRFPGQYADSETGLSDNWFRTYDPATGRYLQSDPIGLWGGINTYAYSLNNPLRYIDSTGLMGRYGVPTGWPSAPGAGPGFGFYPIDYVDGLRDLVNGRNDMIDASTIGADPYFHCRANCEASRRGLGGYHAAIFGSAIREIIQNESAEDRGVDEAANAQGQCAGKDNPGVDCYDACDDLIPTLGLPRRHLPLHANPDHIYRPRR
jgi:RHS repeat-associated protein